MRFIAHAFRPSRSLRRVAAALACAAFVFGHAGVANAAEELEEQVAGLTGRATFKLRDVGRTQYDTSASVYWTEEEWFIGDAGSNFYGGEYAPRRGSSTKFDMTFDAQWRSALVALIEGELGLWVQQLTGFPFPVQIDVTRFVATVKGRDGFDEVVVKVKLKYVARSNAFVQDIAGAYKLKLRGPLVDTRPGAGGRDVIVNRERLSRTVLQQLESRYNVRAVDGRYWYDAVSGLWGEEGGPAFGQIEPGLGLGGRLRGDASNGFTDRFLNGREIKRVELEYIERMCGDVSRGRYWLEPNGDAGREGSGRTLCNLVNQGGGGNGGGGGSRGILGHSLTGSVIGGDGIVGFIDGGTGVTCGPDGGCIF